MKQRHTAIPAGALAISFAVVVGCAQEKIAGDGRAVDAPDRIPALVRQADATGADGLAVLVHALDDDDPAVRLFAAEALRERTGLAFGYRYYDSADRRRPAVRRWRDWLDQQQPQQDTPDDPAGPGTEPPDTTHTAAAPDQP